MSTYYDSVRQRLGVRTLRQCQSEAFAALANYYGSGGSTAACVMSVAWSLATTRIGSRAARACGQ